MEKVLPFDKETLEEIVEEHPTPVIIYDEEGIRENARRLLKAFSWNEGFYEFYAVKACPNPWILQILKEEGFGADCSSLPELVLAKAVGLTGEQIMFTSNNTPAHEFEAARDMEAIINFDDITHVPYFQKHVGDIPDLVCFRYNPGPDRVGNAIIGDPKEAKYGITKDQLIPAYRQALEMGATRFGLHTMVASNELNVQYHIETARMLFDLAVKLKEELGIKLEFVNLGGGIGVDYRPEQEPVNIEYLSAEIEKLYVEKIAANGLDPLRIYMENGRMITGPFGYLVMRTIHAEEKYKTFRGVDATMADFMRPGMYGVYHHLVVAGKEHVTADQLYDVKGGLCEGIDKFAVDRMLPTIVVGDLLVLCDTGAHGRAMGFNYNSKPRCGELLFRPDSSVLEIRRPETMKDHFATLAYPGLLAKAIDTAANYKPKK